MTVMLVYDLLTFRYLKHTLFLASIRTKHEISWTADNAARCPENDDQPTHGDQELEDQLT